MTSASFHFQQVLGTVYRAGNVAFTSDGNTIVSPVGNRVAAFDLVKCGSFALPLAPS
jgi:periodic tryptophan protein 2